MLSLPTSVRVFLASEPVDGRKGFNGLLEIVRGQWKKDAFSGHLFVFLSRRRKIVKALAWSRGGFVLHIKRLERGRFILPPIRPHAETVELDATALTMLLDGIDLGTVDRGAPWQPPPSID